MTASAWPLPFGPARRDSVPPDAPDNVPPGVPADVPPACSPRVPLGVRVDADGPVPPGGNVFADADGYLYGPGPGDDTGPADGGPLTDHFREVIASRILGGGPGGLAAEFRNPDGENSGNHIRRIINTDSRPEWIPVAVYGTTCLILTLPVKIPAEILEKIGDAFAYTGRLGKKASDHPAVLLFIYIAIAAVIVVAVHTR